MSADHLQLLTNRSAYLKGHFLLTSGLHSDSYVQCALALQYPDTAEQLCSALAAQIAEQLPGMKFDAVIGPAMGGIIVAQELGRALGCRAMFMERVDGVFALRRGFAVTPGESLLLCEDVVTTGGSVREVADILIASGMKVTAIASIVDRSGGKAAFSVPFVPLVRLNIPTWKPEDCPLCKGGTPAVKPGSRGLRS
jgi:orotate phosphoribosyltransferase